MKVDTVDFTATAKYPSVSLKSNKKLPTVNHETHLRATDIIPISGLLTASLMSVYFIKKGNLDVGMRALRI
ncbi:MAG: hypothetical protein K6E29_09875 [Cyanobacteria bacterium RUI128]|nr:hypothetical protein [Cyanobacteria bacterium RUI128]